MSSIKFVIPTSNIKAKKRINQVYLMIYSLKLEAIFSYVLESLHFSSNYCLFLFSFCKVAIFRATVIRDKIDWYGADSITSWSSMHPCWKNPVLVHSRQAQNSLLLC